MPAATYWSNAGSLLMQAWAHYLGDQGGKVVKLAARR